MGGIVLITGGNGGIGREIAVRLARDGYTVVITCRSNPEKAQKVVEDIRSGGGAAYAIEADVSNQSSVRKLFDTIDRDIGPLGALVNNAGIIGWQDRVDTCEEENLNHLWATNITSYFLCAREAVLRLSTRHGGKGGAIVNVSSISGTRGGREQRVHYAASKGAINTFTLGLAKEVAKENVRVNAVLPGFILTEFHDAYGGEERARVYAPLIPMGRVGAPNEVAGAVAWLLSDDASFVTAALIEVTGGS